MNPKLKGILIKAAKNAVNAALVSLTPIFHDPRDYNLHSLAGLEHVGLLVAGAIVSRELLVWAPLLLAWSQTAMLTIMAAGMR